MYTDNPFLFPYPVIRSLRHVRGPEWDKLIDEVENLPERHEKTLAFMLMMIRLNGCMSCETDSYRAMKGCEACTHQTLRRLKDDDNMLTAKYKEALEDVREFAKQYPEMNIL
jgi:hypothetical protein